MICRNVYPTYKSQIFFILKILNMVIKNQKYFYIFYGNNILNNNNYLDNNNNQKNNNNNPNNIILEDKNENEFITIYFMLSNQKQLYFDVKSTSYFKDVIRDLRECFTWLNYIQIIDYKYNGKSVDPNKTLEENLIKDSSVINIIIC